MNNNLPNGGFPPIKKCNSIKKEINKFSKDRFAQDNQSNINISKILNTNIKKLILLEEINKIEVLEEV